MLKLRRCLAITAALILAALPSHAWAEDLAIGSAAELIGFRERVNAGEDFAGKTVLLTADIDLGGTPWTPIGTRETPFAGKFNGCNHKITGLNITTAEMREGEAAGKAASCAGLFLNVEGEGAQIANLTVRGRIECAPAAEVSAAGAITARLGQGAVLYRCLGAVETKLAGEGAGRDSYAYAGGLAGYSEGHIIYCVNEGNVTTEASADYAVAGGLVGAQSGGSILFSDNSGRIETADAGEFRAYAGGIAGSVENGSVSCVRNQGEITSYSLAGGVTAYASGAVLRDAVNVAAVGGTGRDSDITAGGIAAQLYSGSAAVNCYNTGSVSASGAAYYAYAGGIAGWSSGGFSSSNVIYNCTNVGAVSGDASSSARVGGLAGEIYGTELRSSVNGGAVSAGRFVAGGITGYKYPNADIHDVAFSEGTTPVGYGDRNVANAQSLTRDEISGFVATAFPSLTPVIVGVEEGEEAEAGVSLHAHPGTPSEPARYYALREAYVEPPEHATAEISGNVIKVTAKAPGVSLLAAYAETYRSGADGAVDRSSPSRSLVTALVWVREAGSEEPPLPEEPEGEQTGGIVIPSGPGEPGETPPPMWPDVPLPSVPDEPAPAPEAPRHGGGGGCSAGFGAMALLALVPLAARLRGKQ